MGARIELWPMNLPCHRCVLTDAAVDAGIAVRLGRVLQVEVDVCRRLALFDRTHALNWEQGWPSCDDDCGKNAK